MRGTRIIKRVLLAIISALAALMVVCNQLVVKNAEGKTFDVVDSVPDGDYVGLLLGTTPMTRISHRRNIFFENRIMATANLYHAGKIRKILISGDDKSLDGINETECMEDSLLARGVPESDIILDGKGYRTIHSVQRAYHDFGCKNLIVISQKFHNERALYLADHLGLNFDRIVGFNAESPRSLMSQKSVYPGIAYRSVGSYRIYRATNGWHWKHVWTSPADWYSWIESLVKGYKKIKL